MFSYQIQEKSDLIMKLYHSGNLYSLSGNLYHRFCVLLHPSLLPCYCLCPALERCVDICIKNNWTLFGQRSIGEWILYLVPLSSSRVTWPDQIVLTMLGISIVRTNSHTSLRVICFPNGPSQDFSWNVWCANNWQIKGEIWPPENRAQMWKLWTLKNRIKSG